MNFGGDLGHHSCFLACVSRVLRSCIKQWSSDGFHWVGHKNDERLAIGAHLEFDCQSAHIAKASTFD
jgi:hypothetical protein